MVWRITIVLNPDFPSLVGASIAEYTTMSIHPNPPSRQSSWLSTIAEETHDREPVNPREHERSDFCKLVDFLRLPITPLVSCTTGRVCPQFPKNVLAFQLLTSPQLDNLARHYHQVWPPTEETSIYPRQLDAWIGTPAETSLDLESKRRRFGLFIGLGGVEALPENMFDSEPINEPVQSDAPSETEAQILEFMETEWQEALLRAQREEGWRFVGK